MLDQKIYPTNIFQLEQQFYQQLIKYSQQVNIYEDPVLQSQALSVIPLDKLKSSVCDKLNNNDDKCPKFKHQLILELLRWFKLDFFSWVDSPTCPNCSNNNGPSKTAFFENLSPTAQELSDQGHRVEGFRCISCHSVVRFVRYNNPGKLLQTKCGRCGEWANCFTLCARAIGFEVRFVHDWTDHVWTEIWSDLFKRWLHVDPCENVYDTPLTYEDGWGKKLNYVLAFSPDEIVDVSWRYSTKHDQLLERRLQCREKWLVDALQRINSEKRQHLPESRRRVILERSICELVEFMTPAMQIRDGGLEGRISGSLQWRQARGELGQNKRENKGIVLRPEMEEISCKEFLFTYCCGKDEYNRPHVNRKVNGWKTLTWNTKEIFRKEEFDWKSTYLSRTEGSDNGEVSWKIDLDGIDIKNASFHLQTTTFHNAIAKIIVCVGDRCHLMLNTKTDMDLSQDDLVGCTSLTVKAILSGSSGNHAWQHAQLFRAPIGSDQINMKIRLVIK